MRTTFLLGAFIASIATGFAALSPNAPATLTTHLIEVNAQWHVQGFVPIDAGRTITFSNEAERIATHLHLVRQQLTTHLPEGLSATQLANRLDLLAKLDRYADRGRFPQNFMLNYRNPVFIDPHGTACAVGQLIIESGHRDLAERISAEMNLAYVLDMPSSHLWSEIAAWAGAHGFTAEELAWIQPAYPPSYPWVGLGGGINGRVNVVKELANGDLLIAGQFTDAGGLAMTNVAVWDGTNYTALGGGVDGWVNCAVEFNGDLYLGGSEFNGFTDLAKWDGNSWSFSTVFQGKYPLINALHVHNGELYAAGAMSGFAGTTEFVQKLTSGIWYPVGSAFDARVHALGSHNGTLIAGGAFTTLQGPSMPPPVMHVAELEGNEWGQHADGLDATVRTLLDVDGTLYAGGDLFINTLPVFGLARIAPGGPSWEHTLPNHADYMYAGTEPTYISSLAEHDGGIYFGGDFSIYQLMSYGTHLGHFGGAADEVMPMVFLDAPVHAVAMSSMQLVMGGEFEASLPHIAVLDLASGTNDPVGAGHLLQLAPNPVTDEVRVLIAGDRINSAPVLFDATGRQVALGFQRKDDGYRASVNTLPAGAYMVQVNTDKGSVTARFVKQ